MKKLLIALTMFSFLSCANMTPEQKTQMAQSAIQLIQIGMTIAQVTGILGEPTLQYSSRAGNAYEYLRYPEYNLVFQDGKLIAITPENFTKKTNEVE